jgi:hypothetical protein
MAGKSICIGVAIAAAVLLGGIGGAGAVGVGGICGPILNGACDPGLFCDHTPGTCALIGGTGKCVVVPKLCPRIWRPVCSCDGKTFGNDCERIKAMAQKAHNGACK